MPAPGAVLESAHTAEGYPTRANVYEPFAALIEIYLMYNVVFQRCKHESAPPEVWRCHKGLSGIVYASFASAETLDLLATKLTCRLVESCQLRMRWYIPEPLSFLSQHMQD